MMRLVAVLLLALASFAQTAAAAEWSAFITAAEVRERLATPGLRIVDLRGSAAYAEGHADGAVSMPAARWQAAADEGKLAQVIGAAGIHPDRPLLLVHYDTEPANFIEAAWIAWTLRTRGIRSVSLLEGGMRGWSAAGLRLTERVHNHRRYTLDYAPAGDAVLPRSELEDMRLGPVRIAYVSVRAGAATAAAPAPVALDELLAGPDGFADRAALLERIKNAPVPWGSDRLVLDGDSREAAPALWFLASEVLGIRGLTVAEPPEPVIRQATLDG